MPQVSGASESRTERQAEALEEASGGLLSAEPGPGGGAGDVPVRTDDAVGADLQIRLRARSVTALTERTRLQARQIITRYPRARSALLPMLHLVQAEQGYVTPEGVTMCAEELGLTKAEVGAVATFYTMYKRRPTGEYLVSVCTNTLCGFLGGDDIYAALADHLGVGHDQTTPDGRITLEHAECLAACDYAPVVTVNYEFYDQQDTDSALNLVRDLQRGQRPHPTRGAPLCSFQEMSRQLAGFYDPVADEAAVNGPSAGEPTLAGAREALRCGAESPAFDPDTPIAPPPSPGSVNQQPAPAAEAEPKPAAQPQPSQSTPADPEPEAGRTAHQRSSDDAVRHSDTPAQEAGAGLADPDTNQETLGPDEAGAAAPLTPAAQAAPATGAGTGPGPSQVPTSPAARRTRSRLRHDGAAQSAPDDPNGRN